jgi:hypothetical protein
MSLTAGMEPAALSTTPPIKENDMPAAADYRVAEYGQVKLLKIKGTSSYSTGRYDLPADWNGSKVSSRPYPPLALNDGSTVIGLVSAGKVKFITAATGAEVANASDQSANTVSVLVPQLIQASVGNGPLIR